MDSANTSLIGPSKIATALCTSAEEIAMTMCLGKDALQHQTRIRSNRSVDIGAIPPVRPFFQSCGAR